ncbi:YgjP-like metallopeptidase domain-containing protein [Thalassobius sp. S69A]|uniref:YgjP-like metallopeptidase domain-containing protein n=1 Tax=unclassified Thalassovita TaxID=2619711 RepID=UPI003C7BE143
MPRTPEQRFVGVETHLYLGRQYRLRVVPHLQESVKLTRGYIVVQTHRPNKSEVTRELVEEWYKERAHIKFPERIECCLELFPDPEAFRPQGLISTANTAKMRVDVPLRTFASQSSIGPSTR